MELLASIVPWLILSHCERQWVGHSIKMWLIDPPSSPEEELKLIASLRAAPPSRRVQGRAQNVSGTYPSRKMGVTIQFGADVLVCESGSSRHL